ncbi:hypothetical protein BJY16_002872 [Actinoplanes octamycinicus]|uniref:Uncharacterized protein n=1 Tax=Actinoplanes octamycinicus TaxID=135948 RepID=A0A7W7M740_9ACTN|nr:hypothetical protein [Actinoplanes octamycinicus]MBB4739413.1 hypothetical protein [Actinoplanes octamycinicus]GIE63493.1 hypothetical protein Aoc01nite_88950 [Actinoplanes octamycinicus]
MNASETLAVDAFLGLLVPLWQIVIGLLLLVTMAVSVRKLLLRGPSRMGGALLLVGSAVVGLAVVSYLIQSL